MSLAEDVPFLILACRAILDKHDAHCRLSARCFGNILLQKTSFRVHVQRVLCSFQRDTLTNSASNDGELLRGSLKARIISCLNPVIRREYKL